MKASHRILFIAALFASSASAAAVSTEITKEPSSMRFGGQLMGTNLRMLGKTLVGGEVYGEYRLIQGLGIGASFGVVGNTWKEDAYSGYELRDLISAGRVFARYQYKIGKFGPWVGAGVGQYSLDRKLVYKYDYESENESDVAQETLSDSASDLGAGLTYDWSETFSVGVGVRTIAAQKIAKVYDASADSFSQIQFDANYDF